jgi:SPP1 gp7 family putative phage head morphogenesis protein
MPDVALDSTSRILGRSLISAETIYGDIREKLVEELSRRAKYATFQEALGIARAILAEAEPIFAEHLTQSDLAAWLAGYHWTSLQFPFWLNRAFVIVDEGPPKPPRGTLKWPWPDDEPVVRFPLIEKAAESLADRGILTKDQFDAATSEVKQRSFTIAGEQTTDTLVKIRDALATEVKEGASLKGFQEKFAQIVDASPIGPAHLENVYRTNVQSSFRDGRETLASDPIVSDVFPYQEYFAIHDSRVRPNHLALEKLGLNGTGIYRRDDPFWDMWTPPNGYQCRCGISLLTVADAAKKGVREAIDWFESGTRPAVPEWRWSFIPFKNEPGFGGRGRVARAA